QLSEEVRARILSAILEQKQFTAWCRDQAREFGSELSPDWLESDDNRIFDEFVLQDPSRSGPIRGHCIIVTGSSGSAEDALAIGLDLILSMTTPQSVDQQSQGSRLAVQRLSIQKIVEMCEVVIRSAIEVA